MKKFTKKVLTLLLVLVVSLSGVIFYLGYREYRDVTENVSIQKQVLEVTQKDDYASLEMIPQIFMDAVVSVEDERYWKRNSTLDFRRFYGQRIITSEILVWWKVGQPSPNKSQKTCILATQPLSKEKWRNTL